MPFDLPPAKLWLPPKPALIREAAPLPRNVRRLMRRAKPTWAGLVPPPILYAPAVAYPTRTNVANLQDTSTGTSHSFASVSVGAAVGTSLVVVVAHSFANAVSSAITAVSIDGTNGTIHQNSIETVGGGVSASTVIVSRATANTSITIAVTTTNSIQPVYIEVYRLNNLVSATVDTSDKADSVATSNSVSTVDITGQGIIIIGGSGYGTSASDMSISAGATQDFAFTGSSSFHCASASNHNRNTASNVTTTATYPVSMAGTIVAATWH